MNLASKLFEWILAGFIIEIKPIQTGANGLSVTITSESIERPKDPTNLVLMKSFVRKHIQVRQNDEALLIKQIEQAINEIRNGK